MDARLVALLIPGDAHFPAADAVNLQDALARHDRFAAPLAGVVARLPDNFATLDEAAATVLLRRIESEDPALFSRLLVGAYSLYYTHPRVAEVIARLTGFTARPPQPAGHALPPFDPALVRVPAARPPSWRRTPGRP